MNERATTAAPGPAEAPTQTPTQTLTARALVPPRPNLGPEPWREPWLVARPMFWIAVAGLVAFAFVALLLRRRLGRSAGTRAATPRPARGAARGPEKETPAPPGQLLELAATLRESLVETLGDPCRALTIEELAVNPSLDQRLGAEDRDALVQFLRLVDQLKFAPESALPDLEALEAALKVWRPRVADWRGRLGRPPQSRSWQKSAWRERGRDGRTPTAPATG